MEDINVARFHLHHGNAQHIAVFIADQIQGRPLDEKLGIGTDILLVERMQHGMAGAVGHGAGAFHRAFAVFCGMAAERTLVDFAAFNAVEGHAHVFQLDNGLGCGTAHKLDRILVAQPVRTFYGVVHMPVPAVFLHVAERGGNAALGGDGVGTGGEHFGQHGGIQAGFGKLQCGAQTRAAAADDDGIKFSDREAHCLLRAYQMTLNE